MPETLKLRMRVTIFMRGGNKHIFDSGVLLINTTDATWQYSYLEIPLVTTPASHGINNTEYENSTIGTTPLTITDLTTSSSNGTGTSLNATAPPPTESSPARTVEIYDGYFTSHSFEDQSQKEWNYLITHFRFNGTLVIDGSVEVQIIGEHSLSIESETGDITINRNLILDGDIGSNENYIDFLGGYAGNRGPGSGYNGDFPGGGGHGGYGGGWYNDNGTVYGGAYGINNDHDELILLGGSSGGVRVSIDDNSTEVRYARGGGAIELKSPGIVRIGGRISAVGQSASQSVNSTYQCAGGGAGGKIRIDSSAVELLYNGQLYVGGGDGSFVPENNTYCGCGGAGGVIEVLVSEEANGYLPRIERDVPAGLGFPHNGNRGYLSIKANNGVGNGGGGGGGNSGGGGGSGTSGNNCPTVNPIGVTATASPIHRHCQNVLECDILAQLLDTRGVTPYDINIYIAALLRQIRESNQLTVTQLVRFIDTMIRLVEMTPLDMLVYPMDRDIYIEDDSSRAVSGPIIMQATEDICLLISDKLGDLEDESPGRLSFVTDAFVMEIEIVDQQSFSGTNFPDYSVAIFEEEKWRRPFALINVPPVTSGPLSVPLKVVSILYANLAPALPGILFTDVRLNESYAVNSRVISSSVKNNISEDNTEFEDDVKITLEIIEATADEDDIKCVFWNYSVPGTDRGGWSTDGCTVGGVNDTHVICLCNHLTNFAVLLKLKDTQISAADSMALEIITYIGCSLSLFGLLLSILTIAFCFRGLNYESASINMNLMVTLGLANIAFLAGADATWNQSLCTGVAMVLHYVYLAAFMWMLVEGMHLYLRVTRVFSTGIYLKFYYPIAYGLPAVVVAITAGVDITSYGSESVCWLSVHDYSIWAFAGPALFIIVVNIGILVVVMHSFLAVKSIAKKPKIDQAK
uniref:Uncharacterized protein LOC102809949 n=1 Tax=Saccoglossus kowalevskii TaxID=10224 RepID=A0ABM0MII8_SACKO|nr:PREDICTED: uncharacterized protein LOC102809949 [Saccoglossus kowalevskii]